MILTAVPIHHSNAVNKFQFDIYFDLAVGCCHGNVLFIFTAVPWINESLRRRNSTSTFTSGCAKFLFCQVEFESDRIRLLKLGDFGLACEVTRPLFTVCGTPTYVAPEILAESGYGLKVGNDVIFLIKFQRMFVTDRRVGGRSDPLHPPVRLSPVREPGQRPGKAVRLHPVRPIRLPRRVLEGRVEFGQGADSEHAPVGTGIAVFRRGRARPSVVEHSEPVEGAHS